MAEFEFSTMSWDEGEPFYVDPAASALPEEIGMGGSNGAESSNSSYTVVGVSGRSMGPIDSGMFLFFDDGEYVSEMRVDPSEGVSTVAVTDTGTVVLLADHDSVAQQEWASLADLEPDQDTNKEPSGVLLLWSPLDNQVRIIDTFFSDLQWLNCTSDHSAIVVLTRFPDRAFHLYNFEGEYLGREKVPTQTTKCWFEKRGGEWYVIAADFGSKHNKSEDEELDSIPVDTTGLGRSVSHVNSFAIMENEDKSPHIVDLETLPEKFGQIRAITGKVGTLCHQQVKPTTASRIYQTPSEAVKADKGLCEKCLDKIQSPMKYEEELDSDI